MGNFVVGGCAARGIDNWKKYVAFDKRYVRPTEVNDLLADARKAAKVLKWKPKIKFKDLVTIMVTHDMKKHGVERTSGTKIVTKKK